MKIDRYTDFDIKSEDIHTSILIFYCNLNKKIVGLQRCFYFIIIILVVKYGLNNTFR